MTDQTPPMPSHAAAKGVALGLGVLLLGGTALLITLLVTGTPKERDAAVPFDLTLDEGEVIQDVALENGKALLLIESETGEQRLVLVDLATGARESVWGETD